MEDHQRLHEQREQEADELEHESERLAKHVEEAKAKHERLGSDEFIATPPDDEHEGDEPPPEAEYPTKD
jgi:hypothetical protein